MLFRSTGADEYLSIPWRSSVKSFAYSLRWEPENARGKANPMFQLPFTALPGKSLFNAVGKTKKSSSSKYCLRNNSSWLPHLKPYRAECALVGPRRDHRIGLNSPSGANHRAEGMSVGSSPAASAASIGGRKVVLGSPLPQSIFAVRAK